MKILHLTLARRWFDMIASGEKKEEYREIKLYWLIRLFEVKKPLTMDKFGVSFNRMDNMYHFLVGYFGNKAAAVKYLWNEGCIVEKDYESVSANNGYRNDCPNIKWKNKPPIRIGVGKENLGAEQGKQYFILEIGEVWRV